MPRSILVKNGLKAIETLLEDYRRAVYAYNSLISGTGYYLKPTHVVTRRLEDGTRLRYIYIGRYWWRLSYVSRRGGKGGVKWRYIGKEKPAALKDYPDPPEPPLAGLRFALLGGDDILVPWDVYERFKWLFKGYKAVEWPPRARDPGSE